MRASIYNAFPKAGARRWSSFMKAFAHEHAGAATA
jgi:phosphoserine aminotransferase